MNAVFYLEFVVRGLVVVIQTITRTESQCLTFQCPRSSMALAADLHLDLSIQVCRVGDPDRFSRFLVSAVVFDMVFARTVASFAADAQDQ